MSLNHQMLYNHSTDRYDISAKLVETSHNVETGEFTDTIKVHYLFSTLTSDLGRAALAVLSKRLEPEYLLAQIERDLADRWIETE